jgi:hypothetical protein
MCSGPLSIPLVIAGRTVRGIRPQFVDRLDTDRDGYGLTVRREVVIVPTAEIAPDTLRKQVITVDGVPKKVDDVIAIDDGAASELLLTAVT